jgi:mRNA-degrading endonuclease YafQ of YafQ-DinJ toxin-antitoxin module
MWSSRCRSTWLGWTRCSPPTASRLQRPSRPGQCAPSRRHPQLRAQYAKTLALLQANPHHPSLRLHALAGKYQGLHSVSINLSYRITLELVIQGQTVRPINVGDHDEVY